MRIQFTKSAILGQVLLLVAALQPAAAQSAPPMPGTLVRVVAPTVSPVPVIGTLVESSTDALVVFQPVAGKKTIRVSDITKLEWSEGRHNNAGSFAKWFAIVGGGIGAIALAQPNIGCENRLGCAGVGALWGGVSGAMYGALIGAFVRTYDWREASLSNSRVSLMPIVTPSRGLGLGVVLRP